MNASKREINLWGPFAGRLKSPDQAPEPLRSALLRDLAPEDIRLLIFSPANRYMAKDSEPTILAVTVQGWLMASWTDGGSIRMAKCDFANTLLVEMTSILLYGLLRVDFAPGGPAQSCKTHFNTVTRGLFQEATELLLNGIDGITAITPVESREMHPVADSLPLKFCNALLEFTPMGQRALAAVHWPAVLGEKRFFTRPELAPQAALVVSDRELMLMSEEKAQPRMRLGQIPKYGNVVTHCPLSRIQALQVCEHGNLDTVDVELRVPRGSARLKIPFPRERKQEVQALVELALRQVEQSRETSRAHGPSFGLNGDDFESL